MCSLCFACRGVEIFFSWCWMLEPTRSLRLWNTLTQWAKAVRSITRTSTHSRRLQSWTTTTFSHRSHTPDVHRKRWWLQMRLWVRLLSFYWQATKPAATPWPLPATCWPYILNANAKYKQRWTSSSREMWVWHSHNREWQVVDLFS